MGRRPDAPHLHPVHGFPAASIGTGVVNLILSVIPLLAMMLIVGRPIRLTILFLPIPIVPLTAFALGVGLLLSSLAVRFPDIADMYQMILQAWMYLTPIMYPSDILPEALQSLPDFNARLNVSILGRPDSNIEFPNIAGRFAPYLDWLSHPEILPIHFEDLINDRRATLTRIMHHLLARVPLRTSRDLILESLESAINPTKSPTFRSGKTGEWKKHFTEEHKRIFKEAAGDLLIRLGYEKDKNW